MKRYNDDTDAWGRTHMTERLRGKWVLYKDVEKLKVEIERLKEKLEYTTADLRKYVEEVSGMGREKEQLKAENEKLRADYLKLDCQFDLLEATCEALRDDSRELAGCLARADSEIVKLLKENEILEENERLKTRIKYQHEDLAKVTPENRLLREEIERLKAENEELRNYRDCSYDPYTDGDKESE